jgi:hypothetical protein
MADLMEELVFFVLKSVVSKNKAWRKNLPNDIFDFMGLCHQELDDMDFENEEEVVDSDNPNFDLDTFAQRVVKRELFKEQVQSFLLAFNQEVMGMLDDGCDTMAIKYLWDKQPFSFQPPSSSSKKKKQKEEEEDVNERVFMHVNPQLEITGRSLVRLVRKDVARLVVDESTGEQLSLYHSMRNAIKYHQAPIAMLSFELDDGVTLETLLKCYPHPVQVQQLPRPPDESLEDKIEIVRALYEEGILVVTNPEDGPTDVALLGGYDHQEDEELMEEGEEGNASRAKKKKDKRMQKKEKKKKKLGSVPGFAARR